MDSLGEGVNGSLPYFGSQPGLVDLRLFDNIMAEKINIEGQEIGIKSVNDQDYISLTDIARQRYAQRPVDVIISWINNLSSIEFLRNMHSRAKVQLRVSDFLERAKAIGIVSKSWRYGETFAHVDIAFEFASWLNPE